jgi:glycosyltransferase involved in cell wall biosynthesis
MRVLQLIDTLNAGGAERVAVNIANSLSFEIDKSFICATRKEGILKENIDKNVDYFFLDRKFTLDFKAILRFKRFLKKNRISIVHAHGSSFFLASLIKILIRNIDIVWHDHYGNRKKASNVNNSILKFCSLFFKQIIAVNKELELWSKKHLWCGKVVYLPNFVMDYKSEISNTILKGVDNKRVLCLANLRDPKDHENLIRAFSIVHKKYPEWSLHFVGGIYNDDYSKNIKSLILDYGLQECVFLYGSRPDVSSIIKQCEIGVLSSKSEGLPMALLEYGLNGLAVVVTDVGECKEVVSGFGLLVTAEDYKALSNAIINYIKNVDRRIEDSKNFQKRVNEKFSSSAVIMKIVSLYKAL